MKSARAAMSMYKMENVINHMGHSMPNQQNKILTPFMKFGTNMDPIDKLSHNKI